MNQKRTFIVVGILLATILLGVGYAIDSETFTVSGSASATATDSNYNVYLDETIPVTVSDESKVTEASITDELTATITVENLKSLEDFGTATYTIKNSSADLNANLSAEEVISTNKYFKTTCSFGKTTLGAGESTTATVKVELIKTPIADQTETISIDIIAQPVEAN